MNFDFANPALLWDFFEKGLMTVSWTVIVTLWCTWEEPYKDYKPVLMFDCLGFFCRACPRGASCLSEHSKHPPWYSSVVLGMGLSRIGDCIYNCFWACRFYILVNAMIVKLTQKRKPDMIIIWYYIIGIL